MDSLKKLRMLPPGGAPVTLGGVKNGLAAARRRDQALEDLRQAFKTRYGARHIFATSSGRSALSILFTLLRLSALEAKNGRDQILLPAYVSFSLPAAVVKAKCRVALYDVDPLTLAPKLESVKAAISERSLAVVACHQFGYPFDLAPMTELCREYGVMLVDDAAQGLGASCSGKAAGRMGDAGIFSFGRSKPLTAFSGGLLLTDDDNLAERFEILAEQITGGRKAGILLPLKILGLWLTRRPEIYLFPASVPWLKLGASIFDPNFTHEPFSPMQAGLLEYSLDRLDSINESRAAKAEIYRQALFGDGRNPPCPELRGVSVESGATPIHLRFPLLPASGDGKEAFDTLELVDQKLGISRGFPLALDEIPELLPHLDAPAQNGPDGNFPGARLLARKLVTLPTHDQVTDGDCRRILARISAKLGRNFTGAGE